MSTLLFADQVVLITGGARGMGRSHALGFARQGAHVSILDLGSRRLPLSYSPASEDEMQRTVADCQGPYGKKAIGVSADVRDAGQVEEAIRKTIAQFGRLDVLVNNAGITTGFRPAHEMTEEEWDKVVDINLKGVWLCSKYAIPHLIAAGNGRIVNISSVAGLVASPGYANYVAAKFGVVGLTKALALELAEHPIRVNCVCPTTVNTPMTRADALSYGLDPENALAEFAGIHPLGRLVEEEDITNAVLWLASEAARFITGVALPVDSGFTIKPPL